MYNDELRQATVEAYKRRLCAFIDHENYEVAGVAVKALTLDCYIQLCAIDNAFVTGSTPEAFDIWTWCKIVAGEEAASAVMHADFFRAVSDIREMMRIAMSDFPPKTNDNKGKTNDNKGLSSSSYGWPAGIIMAIANHTGWSEQEIRSLRMERLSQYMSVLFRLHNPDAPTFCEEEDNVRLKMIKDMTNA